jgi:hypothetical protein
MNHITESNHDQMGLWMACGGAFASEHLESDISVDAGIGTAAYSVSLPMCIDQDVRSAAGTSGGYYWGCY